MEPGKVSSCWKGSVPFYQKLGRGISRILRTSGPGKAHTVFETQADVDRAVSEFPSRVQQEVFNHYLKTHGADGSLSPCTHCTHGGDHVPKKGSFSIKLRNVLSSFLGILS